MGAVVLLRIAAALAALQGIAHGALFATAKPRSDAEAAVIAAMREHRFFGGGARSYWDLYFGYGLIAAAACLVEAALLWQLVRVTQVQPTIARQIVALFVLANVGHALLVRRYFAFPVPIVFDLVIAGLLAATFVMLSRA